MSVRLRASSTMHTAKWLLLALLTSLLLVHAQIGHTSSPTSSELRIGIIGDQTSSSDLNKSYDVLKEGVRILSEQNVQTVLHVGDLVESTKPVNEYKADFKRATAILSNLKSPWHLTAGDHDIDPPDFQPDSKDRSRETLFKTLYGEYESKVKEKLFYSFDVNEYHVVSLNAEETLDVDPRWGDIFLAKISDDQLRWLKADLDQHQSAKAIIVFLHQPLWYNWSGWQRVHQLLKQYPVVCVIAGHFHYNQDEGEIDGIRYAIVGSTGASVKNASRDAGNVHHVTILDLKDRSLAFRIIPIGDTQPISFTSRPDMDRVQSLDQMAGGLYDFERQNPVYLKGRKLVVSCDGDDPAKLKLTPVGNPLEIPMQLKLAVSSENIGIGEARFLPNTCLNTIGDRECILPRGSRIAVANLSSVDVLPSAPLWEGALVLEGSELPKEGTRINLDVRFAFPGDKKEIYLDKRVFTSLHVCK